jgi:hypothetical protein
LRYHGDGVALIGIGLLVASNEKAYSG